MDKINDILDGDMWDEDDLAMMNKTDDEFWEWIRKQEVEKGETKERIDKWIANLPKKG